MSAITPIGENALGGLIASEAHGVIGWVVSLIVEEIKLARGFEKELGELKMQFEELSCIMEGASRQRANNSLMDGWLKKIKDAAEGVDNLLDECSYKALENRIQRRKWSHKIKNALNKPLSHQRMARKVNNLKESIHNIYKHAQRLSIKPCEVAAAEGCSNGCTNSQDILDTRLQNQRRFVDQRLFLGRDYDKKNLVKLICDPINSNSDLTVIGIVGMAGLGKTTLSKCICNLQKVIEFFNPVIPLVISRSFNLESILKNMLEILNKDRPNMGDEQLLISELAKKLKNKRYLLILDDVWDTIDWESLKNILHVIGGSHGSVVLVTSRDINVVAKMELRSCYGSEGNVTLKRPTIYSLEGLSVGDGWSLFMAILSEENLINEKELIARRILKNCRGVPLAIRALGGLLRGKGIERWKAIEKSDLWRQEDENGILPSLRLSYDYLPTMALKKCFAYCAIFEEDQVIQKHELIYMWMAQGFLQDLQPYEVFEDKGEEYIKHLLNSSLFQEARMDDYGNVMTFKIHDLVWSLARVVSMGECLCSDKDERSNEVRHLSIPYNSASEELTITSFTKLRTCMLYKRFKHSSLHADAVLKCRHLRVLDIGSNWSEKTAWGPFGSLIHLRYFGITFKNKRGSTLLNLPNQITKLYHLQTLCIDSTWDSQDQCMFLYPEGFCNLVNLRHILINTRSSTYFRHRTWPVIKLGKNWGGRVSDMGLLTNLRGKLEIHSLASLTDGEEARSLGLASKSNLDSLVLEWGYGKENPKANEILEALQPNKNLQKLEVCLFDGTTFPKWLMGPGSPLNSIVSLRIKECEEADGNLKVENFTCLRILRVEECMKLTVTFPNNRSQCCKLLEELHIISCDRVELLDLSLFPQLWAIEIWDNASISRDNVLVGLGGLRNLIILKTDLQVPADLGEESPVCKSLEELTLKGSEYNSNTTNLPEQLQHLVALQCLQLFILESVEAIPNWLGKLSSLQELSVVGMPKLKHLPPQGVWKSLSNLTSFHYFGCPLLEKDINNITGEWFKIAHIPDIGYPNSYGPERLAGDRYSR